MILALLALCLTSTLTAEEPADLAKRQARSVHLWHQPTVKDAASVTGSVKVTETQPGSYFSVIGWSCGYCGLQDFRGAHWLIFSVWDAVDLESQANLAKEEREQLTTRIHYCAPGVTGSRFGGEGTGAKTMMKLDWKLEEEVRIRIDSEPCEGERTLYTCYLHDFGDGSWKKIAAISTPNHGGPCRRLNGIYSFIEDFRRNYKSATVSRRAEFFDFATRAADSERWIPVTSAIFAADRTPSNAIDAGSAGRPGAFFLQTGGATTNTHVPLMTRIN